MGHFLQDESSLPGIPNIIVLELFFWKDKREGYAFKCWRDLKVVGFFFSLGSATGTLQRLHWCCELMALFLRFCYMWPILFSNKRIKGVWFLFSGWYKLVILLHLFGPEPANWLIYAVLLLDLSRLHTAENCQRGLCWNGVFHPPCHKAGPTLRSPNGQGPSLHSLNSLYDTTGTQVLIYYHRSMQKY